MRRWVAIAVLLGALLGAVAVSTSGVGAGELIFGAVVAAVVALSLAATPIGSVGVVLGVVAVAVVATTRHAGARSR
jgi:hypothetical protein